MKEGVLSGVCLRPSHHNGRAWRHDARGLEEEPELRRGVMNSAVVQGRARKAEELGPPGKPTEAVRHQNERSGQRQRVAPRPLAGSFREGRGHIVRGAPVFPSRKELAWSRANCWKVRGFCFVTRCTVSETTAP